MHYTDWWKNHNGQLFFESTLMKDGNYLKRILIKQEFFIVKNNVVKIIIKYGNNFKLKVYDFYERRLFCKKI